ncbi:N-acetylglucosamine-6-phosphate deacetylase [Paenibacillus contaminans]|uniref:N-acetylglucosamine-6-phosphate deacetylase n=1 Tax=Paenibacillus contaminans TaxID=450362 RepID=A0A329MUZ2_9BACL|nr:amidohydrolase family protein [Paenibacillus contaminans]RAV21767.1 N-acetylglucosamine-6-phosphate deacetylase [Paenibacillus contaminans]
MTGQFTITGRHYASEGAVRITVKEGRIASVEPAGEAGKGLPWIAPGLVDLQINGYAGLDFNTLPLAVETVQQATRLLLAQGVTSYLPTIITNSPEAIEEAMKSIAAACEADRLTDSTIAGIHLEGPFISPEDGARGAHAKAYVRAPDWALFEQWQAASGNRIKVITISPEWPEATAFIERVARAGVIVSIGHTVASPEQIADAVRAGARMSTHLGNGAQLMLPRHPNFLWEQLSQDDMWGCFIADGFHLPDSFLKTGFRAKAGKALLVSDAVSLAGMPPGEYDLHIGGKVLLSPEGRLCVAENPKLLAGSAQLLPWGIAHLARKGLCTIAEAWEMSSLIPGALLGLSSAAGLTEGAPADLVLYSWDGSELKITDVYKNGSLV